MLYGWPDMTPGSWGYDLVYHPARAWRTVFDLAVAAAIWAPLMWFMSKRGKEADHASGLVFIFGLVASLFVSMILASIFGGREYRLTWLAGTNFVLMLAAFVAVVMGKIG